MLGNSLVIGYCICANCGWTDNKFNWHTYFKCPCCGSLQYVKPDLWGDLLYGGIDNGTNNRINDGVGNETTNDGQKEEVDASCNAVVAIFDNW